MAESRTPWLNEKEPRFRTSLGSGAGEGWCCFWVKKTFTWNFSFLAWLKFLPVLKSEIKLHKLEK